MSGSGCRVGVGRLRTTRPFSLSLPSASPQSTSAPLHHHHCPSYLCLLSEVIPKLSPTCILVERRRNLISILEATWNKGGEGGGSGDSLGLNVIPQCSLKLYGYFVFDKKLFGLGSAMLRCLHQDPRTSTKLLGDFGIVAKVWNCRSHDTLRSKRHNPKRGKSINTLIHCIMGTFVISARNIF